MNLVVSPVVYDRGGDSGPGNVSTTKQISIYQSLREFEYIYLGATSKKFVLQPLCHSLLAGGLCYERKPGSRFGCFLEPDYKHMYLCGGTTMVKATPSPHRANYYN